MNSNQPATLDLLPRQTVAAVPDRLFGSFVEHLGRCVYGGIYEPGHPTADADGLRRDVLALTRELGVTVIRYPGGNFVSAYRWEDGVGPRDQRPRRLDPAWGVTETNQFGTDEFITWCRAAGVEPMMAVNLGTRGMQDALDLLEYCNHSSGSALADRRIAHGQRAPHNVRMWCLGNEMDGPWQTGHKTAEEYGRLASETANAMRQFDSSLELVLCGSSNNGMPTFPEWDRVALEHCYERVDFISLHRYTGMDAGALRPFLYRGEDMDSQIRAVIATCDYVQAKVRSKKVMQLSFDEWNVWIFGVNNPPGFQRWSVAPDQLAQIYNLADALVVASMLHALLRHSARMRSACLAQLVNVIAPIRAETGGPAWRQTIFHPFALVARHARGGRVVPQFATSPTEEIQEINQGQAVAVLDSVAVMNDTTGVLTVFALNRHDSEALPLSVRCLDAGAWRLVEHLELSHADPLAKNSAATPNHVAPKPATAPATPSADGWHAVLPPASWHVIRLVPVAGTNL